MKLKFDKETYNSPLAKQAEKILDFLVMLSTALGASALYLPEPYKTNLINTIGAVMPIVYLCLKFVKPKEEQPKTNNQDGNTERDNI